MKTYRDVRVSEVQAWVECGWQVASYGNGSTVRMVRVTAVGGARGREVPVSAFADVLAVGRELGRAGWQAQGR